MYIYICIFICKSICICICICICTCICICICICICMRICIRRCRCSCYLKVYVHMCMYMCWRIHTYISKHTHMHGHLDRHQCKASLVLCLLIVSVGSHHTKYWTWLPHGIAYRSQMRGRHATRERRSRTEPCGFKHQGLRPGSRFEQLLSIGSLAVW